MAATRRSAHPSRTNRHEGPTRLVSSSSCLILPYYTSADISAEDAGGRVIHHRRRCLRMIKDLRMRHANVDAFLDQIHNWQERRAAHCPSGQPAPLVWCSRRRARPCIADRTAAATHLGRGPGIAAVAAQAPKLDRGYCEYDRSPYQFSYYGRPYRAR
jgi:hypothetical protein